MHARIVTFTLDGLSPDDYRATAAAIAESFNDWPGLVFKIWLGDTDRNRYGGMYLFESSADADRSRGTPEFAALEANPHFAELDIRELPVLDEPTAVTAAVLRAHVG